MFIPVIYNSRGSSSISFSLNVVHEDDPRGFTAPCRLFLMQRGKYIINVIEFLGVRKIENIRDNFSFPQASPRISLLFHPGLRSMLAYFNRCSR